MPCATWFWFPKPNYIDKNTKQHMISNSRNVNTTSDVNPPIKSSVAANPKNRSTEKPSVGSHKIDSSKATRQNTARKQDSDEALREVKFCVFNIQGLKGKFYNKLDTSEIQQLFSTHDILLFTETWGNDSLLNDVASFNYFLLNSRNKT